MLKPTVLIVDDEKPTREGLRAALEDRYDVYIAEDGASAIRLLEEDPFDVLLTDLRMPSVGGLDLINVKPLKRLINTSWLMRNHEVA